MINYFLGVSAFEYLYKAELRGREASSTGLVTLHALFFFFRNCSSWLLLITVMIGKCTICYWKSHGVTALKVKKKEF